MKRILSLITLCALLPQMSQAKEISKEEALKAAVEHGQILAGSRFPTQARQIRLVEKEGTPCYYIIQFQPEGWALVSADDRATPLLGYSAEGRFYDEQQPPAMQWRLDEYAEEILLLTEQPYLRRHALWDSPGLRTRANAKIEPLIQVKWDQTAPYNKYCPQNTKGEKAIVGCVAVALAQALSVFQKPDQPTGRNGYTDDDFGLVSVNFAREAPYDWAAILAGSNGNDEAARLLFHCGVAVNMDYGKDASGAYTNRIPQALSAYFAYPPSTAHFYKRNTYADDWISMIVNELAAGRPVIYDGQNDKGTSAHAFNIDGFDGSNSFHVNWGWRGQNNGYFTLANLNDGKFNYLNNHGAVVGIASNSASATQAPTATPAIRLLTGAGGEWTLQASEAGRYEVYGVTGNTLAHGAFQPGLQTFAPAKTLPPSIYIVSFFYNDAREVQKIIIRRP